MEQKPIEGQAGYNPHGPWYAMLDPRQKAMVDHALSYAYNYSHAGVPGHGAHLLIARLA